MNELERLAFELGGGWPDIIGQLIGAALKYICIGAFLHIGWRMTA